jgi:hypothetical protein
MSHNPNDTFSKERFGLITGSVCTPLFPKNSAEVGQKNLAKDLANNMYFRYYDNTSTWQTEHGNNSESSAFEYYQSSFDRSAVYTPKFQRLENWGGQADCICDNAGVDFKCPTTLSGWLDYLHEGISDQQINQSQMYMFLYKKPIWNIAAFLLETNRMSENGEVYPVPYDKRMIINSVEVSEEWQSLLIERTPKVVAMRDFFYSKLVDNFGEPNYESTTI